jgi:hypothetical protein
MPGAGEVRYACHDAAMLCAGALTFSVAAEAYGGFFYHHGMLARTRVIESVRSASTWLDCCLIVCSPYVKYSVVYCRAG